MMEAGEDACEQRSTQATTLRAAHRQRFRQCSAQAGRKSSIALTWELDGYGNKPLFTAAHTFPCLIGARAMLSTGP